MKKVVCLSMLTCLTMQMHGMDFVGEIAGIFLREAAREAAAPFAQQAVNHLFGGQDNGGGAQEDGDGAARGQEVDDDALYHAVVRDNMVRVVALLRQGADVNALVLEGTSNPLMVASSLGRLAIAQFLCTRRANVNAENLSHERPIMFAARANRYEIVRLLADNEADVTVTNAAGQYLDQMTTDPKIIDYLHERIDRSLREREDRRRQQAREQRERRYARYEREDHGPDRHHREYRHDRRHQEYARDAHGRRR